MLVKTKGIVFHSIKYSETSIITKIFTQTHGLQSYIVNGVRSTRAKGKASLFQPLNILDLEIYKREDKNLQRLREYKMGYVFHTIPFDIYKISLLLFLAEVLYKTIKEEEANEALFHFIEQTIVTLDQTKQSTGNYHLTFLLQLSEHLGFFPHGDFSETLPCFDLMEGQYCASIPDHPHYIEPPLSRLFFEISMDNRSIIFGGAERNMLLDKILEYYRLHISSFSEIKSHKVLHLVFEE